MSQADTVLRMLRDADDRGVHTFQIYGAYIANPSQRIAELRDRGHEITSRPERPAPGRAVGARYTLVCDAEHGLPTAGEPTTVPDDCAWPGCKLPQTLGPHRMCAVHAASMQDMALELHVEEEDPCF